MHTLMHTRRDSCTHRTPCAEWLTRAADAAGEPTWFEYDMADLRERQAKIKALGGRFDKERRRWYVPAGLSLAPHSERVGLAPHSCRPPSQRS